jgi:1-acyl-sn-glycerol-3-phosphate acyltransferase
MKNRGHTMTDTLASLTDINLDDLVSSFGWQGSPRLAAVLRAVFHAPAEKFAHQMVDFDRAVDAFGLDEGARRTLPIFVNGLRVFGQEHLAGPSPLLVLSNHPGMTDTLCLFAAIQRPDLRIIALDRPFLQSLPAVRRRLFFIDDDPARRMGVVRQAAAHLKQGGALLTFPAGEIEPDPDVYPGAAEALDGWTDSAGVFARFAPGTRIVPALVRGVLWEKAVKHPLTRLKRSRFEREKLGAALQLLWQLLFDLHPARVTVQFAPPVTAAEVGSTDAAALHAAVLGRMRALLDNPPPP